MPSISRACRGCACCRRASASKLGVRAVARRRMRCRWSARRLGDDHGGCGRTTWPGRARRPPAPAGRAAAAALTRCRPRRRSSRSAAAGAVAQGPGPALRLGGHFYPGTQPFRLPVPPGAGRARQQDREFLSADASQDVAFAQARPSARPRRWTAPVALGVAEAVVDLLEVVDVDHQRGA